MSYNFAIKIYLSLLAVFKQQLNFINFKVANEMMMNFLFIKIRIYYLFKLYF